MKKVNKREVIAILETFKEKQCKTIEEAIELIKKELKLNSDTAFEFETIKGEH